MKTIIFGDTTEDLAFLGKNYQATLACSDNIEDAIDNSQNYYTSFGDILPNDAIRLAKTAKKIIIQPKHNWQSDRLLKTTIYHCRHFSHFTPVENLDFYDTLNFVYQENIAEQKSNAIWLFGGSNVYGAGLPDRNLRFGEILGRLRNMSIVDCSRAGTGIRRSFEMLVSASIKKNDIVVLDTTAAERVRLCEKNSVKDFQLHDCSKEIILATTDDQIFYNQVSYLDAFAKLCSAVGARLVFYSNQPERDNKLLDYYLAYSKHPSWALTASTLSNDPIDRTECNHFGPKTHQAMAELLDQHITQLYENSHIRR